MSSEKHCSRTNFIFISVADILCPLRTARRAAPSQMFNYLFPLTIARPLHYGEIELSPKLPCWTKARNGQLFPFKFLKLGSRYLLNGNHYARSSASKNMVYHWYTNVVVSHPRLCFYRMQQSSVKEYRTFTTHGFGLSRHRRLLATVADSGSFHVAAG